MVTNKAINITGEAFEEPNNELIQSVIDFVYDHLENWRGCIINLNGCNRNEVYLVDNLVRSLSSQEELSELDFRFIHQSKDNNQSMCIPDIIAHYKYGQFKNITAFECKILPTPNPRKREKEYVSYCNSRDMPQGGVQRFKLERHGSFCNTASIIGFIQKENFNYFYNQINSWIEELKNNNDIDNSDWSNDKCLEFKRKTNTEKTLHYISEHARIKLKNITINHLWIDIQ